MAVRSVLCSRYDRFFDCCKRRRLLSTETAFVAVIEAEVTLLSLPSSDVVAVAATVTARVHLDPFVRVPLMLLIVTGLVLLA